MYRCVGSGAWDAGGVSNPELVDTENGEWYLYYTGQVEKSLGGQQSETAARSAVGVAVATGNDFTTWTRIET